MTTTASTGIERSGSILRHTMKKERPALVARTGLKRNVAGHDLGTVDLEPSVFGLTPNRAVLHQVVTAQLAGIRSGTQSTKTRAEVRGGGAKPFRQKGTGRARQGSSRSPSMSGGGVALGPKPRSYEQRTPKKMIRLALLSALSDMAETGHVIVLDDWQIEEPDTRAAAVILKKLRITGTVLAVLANDEIDVALSLRNLPEASITTHAELSAHDVVRADWLLFTERTVPTSPSDFSGTHLIESTPPQAFEAEGRHRAGGEGGEGGAGQEGGPRHQGHEGREGADRRDRGRARRVVGGNDRAGRDRARRVRRDDRGAGQEGAGPQGPGRQEGEGGRRRCVTPCPC